MSPTAPVRPENPRRKAKRFRQHQAAGRPPERPDFPERDVPSWKPLG